MLPYRIIGNNGCCQTLSRYFWPTSTVVSLHNLCKQKSISHVGRENFSTQIENSNQPTFVDFNIAKLTNRSVVRIFGNDSRDFLQGTTIIDCSLVGFNLFFFCSSYYKRYPMFVKQKR